jgi:predicted nucleic acid-binding protein
LVFADTSGFVAGFDARDVGHPAATRAFRTIAKSGQTIVTTDLVVSETLTHLRRRGGWEPAKRAGDAIFGSRAFQIVCADRESLEAGYREFVRNADPKLSLCDAHSFIVMRDRGITRALTFDRHFADAGFQILA